MDTAGQPRRLELEVQFEAQPIQGRLYDREQEGGVDRPFSGWLGLLSALEAARAMKAPRDRTRRPALGRPEER
jgi:hypothetical protein